MEILLKIWMIIFDPKDPKAALQYKNTEVRRSLFIIESYVKENVNQNVSRSFWTDGWIIVENLQNLCYDIFFNLIWYSYEI